MTPNKIPDLPSNSKNRMEPPVAKVVSGNVVRRRKKTVESGLSRDLRRIVKYLGNDVLLPAFKSLISDMFSNGVEMMLYGEDQPRSRKRTRGGLGHVAYGSYFAGDTPRRSRRHESSRTRDSRSSVDDIVYDSRGDADEVMASLLELISRYGAATVADLYDLVGMTAEHTDNRYGWESLGSARIVSVRGGGYALNLPVPKSID